MALAEYRQDMETCCRCSACKFIPLENVKGLEHASVCPSISRYNFHAYSGGGKLGIGVALLEKELDYSDKLLEVIYNCQMCGACDVSCKYALDMEVLDPIQEIRIECVKNGKTLPVLDKLANSLRKQGPMILDAHPRKGNWFDGLDVKDFTEQPVDVVFHAGCRTAFDMAMWKVAQSSIALLQKAGITVGIGGTKESCCGGRAYQMGYAADFLKQAQNNMEVFKKAGVKTLVTGCAECYHAFKVLYDKFNLSGDLKVLHITEYLNGLIRKGDLKPDKKLNLKVTYHDPCHLGRLGEPYIHWEGKRKPGQIILFDPPKEFRRGTKGVYEPPREILRSIPGLTLQEMDRIKEYAWCCGAGGGVKETNPEFAIWTANERLKEAESSGAEALVTACPGCERNFTDALKDNSGSIKIFDVVELLAQATL